MERTLLSSSLGKREGCFHASDSYNGLDTRVGKTENSVANTFRRSGAYVTDPVLGDGSASYTPGVSVRSGGNVRYQHTGLKNTDSQTSPAQSVAASRIYDAFGNVVSSSGTWTGPFGYAGNFGYQQDASGLKLLGHRYYDPSTGRFLTRDPIKDGRNWYAYGAGESAPTTIADPLGLYLETLFDIAMFGWSLSEFAQNPSPSTAFALGLDGAALLLPVPAVGGAAVRGGRRIASQPQDIVADNVRRGVRFTDAVSRLSLRGKSFNAGDKKLRALGLRRVKCTRSGGYAYFDKNGKKRAMYHPARDGKPSHWHKLAPDGTTKLNDQGKSVADEAGSAHIRAG